MVNQINYKIRYFVAELVLNTGYNLRLGRPRELEAKEVRASPNTVHGVMQTIKERHRTRCSSARIKLNRIWNFWTGKNPNLALEIPKLALRWQQQTLNNDPLTNYTMI